MAGYIHVQEFNLRNHQFDQKSLKSRASKTASKPILAQQTLTIDTASEPRIPLPFGFSLRTLANGTRIPVEVLLVLGWLSGDERARAVRDRWMALPRRAKLCIDVEDLCRAASIDGGQFFGLVVATAFKLGMDVSVFVSGVLAMTAHSIGCVKQSRKSGAAGFQRLKFAAPARTWALPTVGCDEMAAFRKKWKLSARQFSELFGTGIRGVQWWESHKHTPAPRYRWVLELFRRYVGRNGVSAFRRRFVRQPPRYRKPGRPVSA
jgi:DNA-binding transcriptional regulator YiaG